MPLYNYHCDECVFDFEYFQAMDDREICACPSCSGVAHQMPSTPNYIAFPEGVFDDIAADPIYVSDKRQLKDECKKHGVRAPGILD